MQILYFLKPRRKRKDTRGNKQVVALMTFIAGHTVPLAIGNDIYELEFRFVYLSYAYAIFSC